MSRCMLLKHWANRPQLVEPDVIHYHRAVNVGLSTQDGFRTECGADFLVDAVYGEKPSETVA